MNNDIIRKSHVSPGVYTREFDLTYVAKNIGGTTLGLVGETMLGRAFEPMFIEDYNTFRTYFGGTNPELFKGSKYPKYELPYVAKSFLKKSNQLYVTRVLGLSGYDAGTNYVLKIDETFICNFRAKGSVSSIALAKVEGGDKLSNTYFDITISFSSTYKSKSAQPPVVIKKVSFNPLDDNFILRIIGDKYNSDDQAIYIDRFSQYAIKDIIDKANIVDSLVITSITSGAGLNNYKFGYRCAHTPYIISKGANPLRLFKFVTLSDGCSANYMYKVCIENIDEEYKTFDVVVRDYNDTDEYIVVLEKYTKCSMDIDSPNFIGNKIGTTDGLFDQRSQLISVEYNDSDEMVYESIPCGFEGYSTYDTISSEPKIEYNTVYKPNIKEHKQYFGIKTFGNDSVFVKPLDYSEGISTSVGLTLDTTYDSNLNTMKLECVSFGTATDKQKQRLKKFCLLFVGGWDGWDVTKNDRQNHTDVIGTAVSDPNSDYNAYLKGIQTMSNPQFIDIDIFATPGLDWYNHSALVEAAIEMVEDSRNGDCLYIVNSPDKEFGMSDSPANMLTPDQISYEFSERSYDTSYAATYYPWVKYFDSENGKYIYLPITKDIVRNMASIDSVSYPWFAPAGKDRGDIEGGKVKRVLDIDEEDILYKNRINPIKTFPKEGFKVWGQKTMQVRDTQLNRINIRRLLIKMKKLVVAASMDLIFEQNDSSTESKFRSLIQPILDNIRENRGITDYKIVIDNSAEAKSRLSLPATIMVKPIGALEYIELTFTLTPEGVNFDDV